MTNYDSFYEVERVTLRSSRPQSRRDLHAFALQCGMKFNEDFHSYFIDRLGMAEAHQAISIAEFFVLYDGARNEDYEEDFAESNSQWDCLEAEYLLASLPPECITTFVRECGALAKRFELSMRRGENAVSAIELQADLQKIAVELANTHGEPGSEQLAIEIKMTYPRSKKCDGISLGQSRHPLCARSKHETVSNFVARQGEETLRRYFSFAVVRHPTERLLFHFAYLKSNPAQFPEMAAIRSAEEYIDAIARNDADVIKRPERVMEQWRYVTVADGVIGLNKIYRFEHLSDMLADISQRLGVILDPLPRKNVSDGAWKNSSPAVDDFARAYYAKDFELFGYA